MAIVYKGRVFSVEVSQMTFPNGQTHEKEIVHHAPSVVLIPIAADGRVILVRQFRAPLNREIWELSAGGVNAGETPEQAAARECEEEMRLVPGTVERLRAFYPAPGFCDEELIFFRVSDLTPSAPDSPNKPDADEEIFVEPFTIDEAKAMVANGAILDLKTAYGLTLI
jgi:ADP-ribose pyrophosphatase